jgi:hypothetical protein
MTSWWFSISAGFTLVIAPSDSASLVRICSGARIQTYQIAAEKRIWKGLLGLWNVYHGEARA